MKPSLNDEYRYNGNFFAALPCWQGGFSIFNNLYFIINTTYNGLKRLNGLENFPKKFPGCQFRSTEWDLQSAKYPSRRISLNLVKHYRGAFSPSKFYLIECYSRLGPIENPGCYPLLNLILKRTWVQNDSVPRFLFYFSGIILCQLSSDEIPVKT